MTSHQHDAAARPDHAHGHGRRHGHGPAVGHDAQPDPAVEAALAELLDLDAAVFAGLLADVVARVAAAAPAPVRTVLDLGAGTGTGTVALARAFPAAQVVAVDASPAMLERTLGAAEAAGVADRVRTVEADLDAAWPDTPDTRPADVVWASASLHHVADPARVLRDAHAALAPGGLVAVVEITGSTPVIPSPLDRPDRPGLGERLADATVHAAGTPTRTGRPPSRRPGSRVSGAKSCGRRRRPARRRRAGARDARAPARPPRPAPRPRRRRRAPRAARRPRPRGRGLRPRRPSPVDRAPPAGHRPPRLTDHDA
ncbi:trans-aconitate 2-methyltransferase [Cellulosimicrobium sp. CUA-896]|uniref:class I SAM-dependent methyltransferase n=1 Tax=Cellulosimicrobium sp. CUA-896 TaxID=1517881 RepID=UPI000963DF4D|nr:class I SAM-dependent methyltransferase [Cellulosimicrobium sp. CUA-896]OLT52095.1 hypothetical protein BJF88_14460 [Cellulosimicrobium sp. CUA-896]